MRENNEIKRLFSFLFTFNSFFDKMVILKMILKEKG